MTDRSRTTDEDHTHTARADGFGRREFVALGAGASVAMLAGCAGSGSPASSDGSGDADGSSGGDALTGSFRLLISDAPADIGDFDRLDVQLSEARVFEAEGDDEEEDEEGDEEDDSDGGNETDVDDESDGNVSDPENGDEQDGSDAEDEDATDGDSEAEDEDGDGDDDGDDGDDEGEDDEDEDDRGFTVIDLDGATVDLTQVIEEDAIAVFDGEVPAGSYEKIELAVSEVQGIVDGGEVDVKLPSEKLQITNEFEVTPDGSVSFVFDINVVKRGPNGYILKPVISGSGVAGRDVEVNEIDEDDEDEDDEDEAESEESADEGDESDDDGANETDDDAAGNETDDDAAGNETDDDGAGNETAGDGS